MHQTTGIILVTGPTGSGKSTTLYGALTELNTPEKNIMTIEDPVEYQIRGINQMHVRSQIDLSFAKGLRAILRQDPDVIMVGEIRDVETARIAVQAALTGHLVFSTLHTNDAVSSLIRLIDMGIEPYLVNSSVNAIMAQRLTRVICPHCKADYTPSQTELDKLSLQQSELAHGKLYYGAGCSACKNTGFLGRMMINEFLEINEEIQDLLNKNASSAEIKEAARRNGMRSMREDAKIKVIKGYTTLEEVLRVSV
jgi:type II secretory ATPase GspE/PulE/Tfp pilus assembly ATPase PilB-like protein